MTKLVETLCEKRSLLLGFEVIGWLHMLGKANRRFLLQHGGGDGGDYDDHKDDNWYKELDESWDNYWDWLKKTTTTEPLYNIK